MTLNFAQIERQDLCTLFEDLGPDVPTLCEGWTARDLAAHLVVRERRPDAALGILAGNREQHATFGVSSLSSLRPVAPDTLFQIGSLTKTFTATAIWKLIDQGDLELDAPVRRYLRGLRLKDPQTAETVTLANLLEHTCGWYGDGIFDTGEDSDALGRYVDERLYDILDTAARRFTTTDPSYVLLGANARLSFGPDGNYSVSLWGKNLTDEIYFMKAQDFDGLNGGASLFPGNPRTFGLSVSAQF